MGILHSDGFCDIISGLEYELGGLDLGQLVNDVLDWSDELLALSFTIKLVLGRLDWGGGVDNQGVKGNVIFNVRHG